MQLSKDQILDLIENSRLDYRDENVKGTCPKCGEAEFGISLKNNHPFGCYRSKKCGFRGNIYTLLGFLGRLKEYLEEGSLYQRKDVLENKLLDDREIDLATPVIKPPIGYRKTTDNAYLNGRGFSEVEYSKYEVGTSLLDPDLRDNYVIFLIRRFGDLVGYVARHVWTKEKIKKYEKRTGRAVLRYQNSKETYFGKLLFGYEELTENTHTVILVEGIFDKVNIDFQLQLDTQEEIKCLSTFKAEISPEQIHLIQQFVSIDMIILFYDPDVINQIKKTGLQLEKNFKNIYISYSGIIEKDPGDMNYEDIQNCFDSLFTVEEFVTKKIQKKELI